MSEEPLSSDSASEAPKKSRRVSTPRPRKTAKKVASGEVVAEKPAAVEPAPAPAPVSAPVAAKRGRSAPAPAPAVEAPAARSPEYTPLPRDPRLDDISGHERESTRSGWPEPETIQGGGGEGSGSSGKRKRRRKKKGGQGGQLSQGGQDPVEGQGQGQQGQGRSQGQQGQRPPQAPAAAEHSQPRAQSQPQPQQQPQPQSHQQQGPRIAIDLEDLSKKAWRIFLGEVGEEGLALIGDQDAREISRRSFKLAEIFLEEQGRRAR